MLHKKSTTNRTSGFWALYAMFLCRPTLQTAVFTSHSWQAKAETYHNRIRTSGSVNVTCLQVCCRWTHVQCNNAYSTSLL